MKNFSFILCLLIFICSCNSSDKKIAENLISVRQDFSEGKEIYNDFCIQCHMPNGEGVPKTFPPLANSDYLKNNRIKSIKAIKYGLSGEITVNGVKYNTTMAAQGLSDKEIASVMNYITNSWGNKNNSLITEEEVSKIER
ncbi:cbb3-type cytochrome c oxidase subunit III [Lacinutrix venerupis]|uniref:c-type cytochrome n=1 Tax=Lacinutrix venerupis TaxID=1486034 RepID=UPI000EB5D052|nr:cytochrome c [Lacinutrix venerupis]RLJ64421.1 cbb3-type cytochrome c oxidase subunit III [Lacinutrix venerupis]